MVCAFLFTQIRQIAAYDFAAHDLHFSFRTGLASSSLNSFFICKPVNSSASIHLNFSITSFHIHEDCTAFQLEGFYGRLRLGR